MKDIKPYMRSMRTDFEFSTRAVRCPNASLLGFSSTACKPGSWIRWCMPDSDYTGYTGHGRVIGAVDHIDDKGRKAGWLMVVTLSDDLTNVYMRWIDPAWVTQCLPTAPREALAFITGEWEDPQAICDQMERGFGEDIRAMLAASTR